MKLENICMEDFFLAVAKVLPKRKSKSTINARIHLDEIHKKVYTANNKSS